MHLDLGPRKRNTAVKINYMLEFYVAKYQSDDAVVLNMDSVFRFHYQELFSVNLSICCLTFLLTRLVFIL